MNKKLPLIVAGIIFSIVTVIHLMRLYYHWLIIINGNVIPYYVSIIGAIVTGLLSLWMFLAARK